MPEPTKMEQKFLGMEGIQSGVDQLQKLEDEKGRKQINETASVYFNSLLRGCTTLSFMDMDKCSSDVGGKTDCSVALSQVYIPLNTTQYKLVGASGRTMAIPEDAEKFRFVPIRALEALTRAEGHHTILTGPPGSGKSSFVNHLTYYLAYHHLYPNRGWLNVSDTFPADLSDLIPIPITLRNFNAWRAINQPGATGVNVLLNWLAHWLETKTEDAAFLPALKKALSQGKALLLFDGLDEVPVQNKARGDILKVIEAVRKRYTSCPMLVTCRILAYTDPVLILSDETWFSTRLAQFGNTQIHTFIKKWHARFGAESSVNRLKYKAKHMQLAMGRRYIRELASNPLLLTVMAWVHISRGTLPEDRELLYHEAVDVLLWRWQRVRLELEDGQETDLQMLLSEAHLTMECLKQELWKVAFEIHGRSPVGETTADIPILEFRERLEKLSPKRSSGPEAAAAWAVKLLNVLQQETGLLVPGGEGVLRFPDRTFQMYLAACEFSCVSSYAKTGLELAKDRERWWSVILLSMERLQRVGEISKAFDLISSLCPEEKPDMPTSLFWHNAWLAGESLLRLGVEKILGEGEKLSTDLVVRVRSHLAALLTAGALEPRERAKAGSLLGAIGDPRLLDPRHAEAWVLVPGCTFMMGSKEGDNEDVSRTEVPQHRVSVPDYWLCRYPVTEAAYEVFVRETGHRAPEYWTGNRCLERGRNHPVVEVNSDDVKQYCEWITKSLRAGSDATWKGRLVDGLKVRLPSEAEWERAARGPDGDWAFPYPGPYDPVKCNGEDVGINGTSPVGMFPRGAAPIGRDGALVYDLSGNVSERCEDVWHRNYEGAPKDGSAWMKGGDQDCIGLRGGSFMDCDFFLNSANRGRWQSVLEGWGQGFRVALSVPPPGE